jgi:hypothetical protein
MLEQREHVEMGHADAEPHQPLGDGASERPGRPTEGGEHLLGRLASLGEGVGRSLRGDGSHEVKYLRHPNNPVKSNH